MKKTLTFYAVLLLALFSACNQAPKTAAVISSAAQDSSLTILRNLNDNLTESIVDDGFSPPVASRIYSYTNIAFYETVRFLNPELHTLAGRLNKLPALPTPDTSLHLDFRIAAIEAFTKVAVELVYRDNMIVNKKGQLQAIYFNDSTSFKNSVSFGAQMADSVLKWMSKDYYKQTRTMAKFPVSYKPGHWIPTAPAYNEAIEPHFMKLRPFALDTVSQFRPQPTIAFSLEKNSAFYKQAIEVYEAVNSLNDSTTQIARHWDCNPVPSTVVGHLKYVRRQLTPGGHWIWIAGKVSQEKNLRLSDASFIQCLVAIGLYDAFMSCWDSKYATDRIRPETYIKDNIDRNWKPFLETPQFPEYTSGHSTISASASTILTHYFGDSIPFLDSAEVSFGLAPRNFNSFHHAANEATISRLLGGIHFRDACTDGQIQGKKVGELVWQKAQ